MKKNIIGDSKLKKKVNLSVFAKIWATGVVFNPSGVGKLDSDSGRER